MSDFRTLLSSAKRTNQIPLFDLERAYADCHELVWELLKNETPGTALDLAAGQGALSYALAQRGFTVNSVDVYPEQFHAPGLSCQKLDLNQKSPFSSESFDVVLAVEILEHLEAPRAFLREIFRLLRPGGLAVITTPNISSLPSRFFFLATGYFDLFVPKTWRLKDAYSEEADGHISPLPAWLVRYFLQDIGFSIEEERYTMAYLPKIPRKFLHYLRGPLWGRCGIWAARKPRLC